MAINPNFRSTRPHLAPDAISNIVQRKQQLELQQRQQAEVEKQNRFNQLMSAIEAGGKIASNMVAYADKKREQKQIENLATGTGDVMYPKPRLNVEGRDVTGQLSPADQRKRDFVEALVRNQPKTAAELFKAQTGTGKQGTPPRSNESLAVSKLLNGDFGDPQSPEAVNKMRDFQQSLEPAGYKYVDPEDGKTKIYNPVTKTTTVVSDNTETSTPIKIDSMEKIDTLPPLQKKRTEDAINKSLDRIKTDPIITANRKAVNEADSLENLIKNAETNEAGVPIVKFRVIRAVAEEVGNLNRTEVEQGGGNQAALARVKRWLRTNYDGTLPPEDIDDFLELARIAKERSTNSLRREENKEVVRLMQMAPNLSKELAEQIIRGQNTPAPEPEPEENQGLFGPNFQNRIAEEKKRRGL